MKARRRPNTLSVRLATEPSGQAWLTVETRPIEPRRSDLTSYASGSRLSLATEGPGGTSRRRNVSKRLFETFRLREVPPGPSVARDSLDPLAYDVRSERRGSMGRVSTVSHAWPDGSVAKRTDSVFGRRRAFIQTPTVPKIGQVLNVTDTRRNNDGTLASLWQTI